MILANRLSLLGYAFPGAVLAIGLYLPLVRLDNYIADTIVANFKWDPRPNYKRWPWDHGYRRVFGSLQLGTEPFGPLRAVYLSALTKPQVSLESMALNKLIDPLTSSVASDPRGFCSSLH